MKKLKDLVNEERKKLLDEDNFLDDVLYPIIDENIKTSKQKQKIKAYLLYRSNLIAPILVVVFVAIVGLYIFLKPETEPYLSIYGTKPSDLNEVNLCLKNTQIIGDLQSIVLTYEIKRNKTVFFSLSQEILDSDSLVNCTIEVIVDKSYKPDKKIEYNKNFVYLNFTVIYLESVNQSTYEEIEVNEFTILSFIDTGQERYYFTYNEITSNDFNGFQEYLKN